jgi:hypothetical protein
MVAKAAVMATAAVIATKDAVIAPHAARRVKKAVAKAAMRAVVTDEATAADVVVVAVNVGSAKAQARVNAWIPKAATRK